MKDAPLHLNQNPHKQSLFVITVIMILLVFVIVVLFVLVNPLLNHGVNTFVIDHFFFYLDFDLCHSCFSIVKENHPEHIFVTRLVGTQASKKPKNKKEAKIFNPAITSTITTTTTTTVDSPQPSHDANNTNASILHLGVYCDNCQTEITGIRFKVKR